MNRAYLILFFVCVLVVTSCNSGPEDVPLDTIELDLDVDRFDLAEIKVAQALRSTADVDRNALYDEHLKPHHDFLVNLFYFGNDSAGTDEVMKSDLVDYFLNDSNVANLMDSVEYQFPEGYDFEAHLLNPMKRFYYYFPDRPLPKIRTFVSGYSTNGGQDLDQIQLKGEYLGLGLHYFLGEHFPWYPPDIPEYVRKRFSPEYLNTMVFRNFALRLIPPLEPWDNPRLVDRMMRAGMRLYFLDKMLPYTPDSIKVMYSESQMEWANYYEGRIFAELLPHLYVKDNNTIQKYLEEAPYTQSLSRESAPRIAEFCGWMAIRKYMTEHPELGLGDLLIMKEYDRILKDAKYRPKEPE